MAAEDLTRDADSITVCPENQISIEIEGLPNWQEVERLREIVRQFFNSSWTSTDDQPGTLLIVPKAISTND
jgi:hypothetical protein